jgi:tetratricopeptide (TPR) repeat protein
MKRALVCGLFISACAWHGTAQTSAKPTVPPSARIETLSKEAETARKENRIDDAIALYKKGVALRPSWDEGWWFLGTLYYNLDDYQSAQSAFKHLSLIKPDVAVGWGMLGLCEFENREYDYSLRHLEKAITLGIGTDQEVSDVVHFHYVMLLTRSGRFEEAMKNLAMFAQRDLNQPDYVEAMGLAALRKPLLAKELPPAERELVMDAGRAMYDASALKATQAAAEFKILVEKFPKEPNVHYVYGSFLLFSDVDAGLAEIKKELDISPAHVPALVTLASEYTRVHEFQTALPFAEKAVATDPQSFAAHAVVGRVLYEGNLDLGRGIKELEEARKLEPGSPQVRGSLASAYAKAGRKDEAAKEREAFLALRKLADENEKSVP